MTDYFTKHACTYCQETVSGIMIQCMQCSNFYLCLQCFSCGAEIGPHENNHSYKFLDSGASIIPAYPTFTWSAQEHNHLLYAVEKFGYGNFEEIAKHIKTKTPEEANTEFTKRFIEGTIGRLTWPPLSSRRNIECSIDHSESSLETTRPPITNIPKEETSLLGYTPQRNEFEWEYDNSAESQVSYLDTSDKETELSVALKLAQVDMFIRRLRERTRRKRVANDFDLITSFLSQSSKNKSIKNKSKEESEFHDRMRVFTQFHTAHEHEQFLENLKREQELRLRCAELARYRQNGITKLEECFHFEQVRQQHDEWKEKRSDSSGYAHLLQALALKKRKREGESSTSRNGNSTHRPHPYAATSSSHDIQGSSSRDTKNSKEESLASLPAYHLLSNHEIKDQQLKNVKNDSSDTNSYSEIEKHLKSYFKKCGWITR